MYKLIVTSSFRHEIKKHAAYLCVGNTQYIFICQYYLFGAEDEVVDFSDDITRFDSWNCIEKSVCEFLSLKPFGDVIQSIRDIKSYLDGIRKRFIYFHGYVRKVRKHCYVVKQLTDLKKINNKISFIEDQIKYFTEIRRESKCIK